MFCGIFRLSELQIPFVEQDACSRCFEAAQRCCGQCPVRRAPRKHTQPIAVVWFLCFAPCPENLKVARLSVEDATLHVGGSLK